MKLKKLSLLGFRNYDRLDIEFSPYINVLYGENGIGKTNLVEAIYYTGYGKSFRTLKDKNLININSDILAVKSLYEKDDGSPLKIEIKLKNKKEIKVNNNFLKKTTAIVEKNCISIFSPEDLDIIKKGPQVRRNYINKEISTYSNAYLDHLLNYNKALKHRNSILKDRLDNDTKIAMIDAFNEQLINHGTNIIKHRIKYLNSINKSANELHSKITNGKENIEIKYITDIDSNNIEQSFEDILSKNYKKDVMYGSTTSGPHRDDIDFFINNINAKDMASQGQQRTLAISIKLAGIKEIIENKQERPVLILDDIMSELDNTRKKYLLQTFSNLQIFITTAVLNKDLLNSMISDANIINIEDIK